MDVLRVVLTWFPSALRKPFREAGVVARLIAKPCGSVSLSAGRRRLRACSRCPPGATADRSGDGREAAARDASCAASVVAWDEEEWVGAEKLAAAGEAAVVAKAGGGAMAAAVSGAATRLDLLTNFLLFSILSLPTFVLSATVLAGAVVLVGHSNQPRATSVTTATSAAKKRHSFRRTARSIIALSNCVSRRSQASRGKGVDSGLGGFSRWNALSISLSDHITSC